jgi:predicted RNA-binding Zn ribbon-like protein
MPPPRTATHLIAGRLALDFANISTVSRDLSWDEFISFLVDTHVVTEEKAGRLRPLLVAEPQAVDGVLLKVLRLREAIGAIFSSLADGKSFPKIWVEPINEILRVTEGHDELKLRADTWRLEFIARESGLDWLLAAIARSAAELLVEGTQVPVRHCANPSCRLFFYDDSRTHRRRWCSMARCGNRSKVTSFLRRQAAHRRNS